MTRVSNNNHHALAAFGLWLGAFLLAGLSVWMSARYGIGEVPQNFGRLCTQEARQCPDGSYVSRTGPSCEFAACPFEDLCKGRICSGSQGVNQTALNVERDLWGFNMGDSIILYWADLPSNTDTLVFYRSESKSGPWAKVLSVAITDSIPQQVVDSITGNRVHFYRADALRNNVVIKSYSVLEIPKYINE